MEVFNIGTGRGLSVLELINAFEKATGVKLNYQIVGRVPVILRRYGQTRNWQTMNWVGRQKQVLKILTFCMEMAVEAS